MTAMVKYLDHGNARVKERYIINHGLNDVFHFNRVQENGMQNM